MSETKVVIVTGSSSGIGEAAAHVFCENGYHVVITGSNPTKVDRVLGDIKQKYPDAPEPLGIVVDFQDPTNVDSIIEKTISEFGRLDVLVNNAGRARITPGGLIDTYEAYRQIMTINLDSTVRLTSLATPYLRKTNGNVVNVSSVLAFRPPDLGYAYSASKAAMVMFGRCLAIDLAPDIRVNNVLPGPIITDIGESMGYSSKSVEVMGKIVCVTKRSGLPKEVADVIYFLASDKAAFITGSDFVIDGGCSIKPLDISAMLPRKQKESSS